jgi:hypothetical protein
VCRAPLGNALCHFLVAPDRSLNSVDRLIVRFRRAESTPQLCHQFETQMYDQLRELGRLIVEWTFNHIEPHDRADMSKQMCFQGVWYR